ncbi:adenylate kinase [Candidatus Parcubacteria bacterium]|nr:MAG: adenylate kinase [Candidatus Parcubacteria bacterium]
MKKNIVLFGPQGSGKGTQAQLSSKAFRIPHISTGDIFRQNIKEKTELGQKIEKLINSGKLVPDDITNEIVKERLQKDDCSMGFILDGFPRTLNQAQFLSSFININLALEIFISDEEAIKRIGDRRTCSKCGAVYHLTHLAPREEGVCDKCYGDLIIRDDDKEKSVKKRLETYHKQTEDLINFYYKEGIYKKVDGMQTIADVNNAVGEIIKSLT